MAVFRIIEIMSKNEITALIIYSHSFNRRKMTKKMELKTEYKTHDVTGTQTVSDLQEKPKKRV